MKQKLKNLLCSAALLLGATAATAQGLQNIIVEEFHTVTQADADAYNNDHGGGSFPLVAGMKTYRVYVDMAPNYRLTSVFATPNSPLSVNSTTTFWNDDNWGSEGPGQTRRLDEGNLFDSFITINTASTSSTGTTPCGATAHTSQFGVQRTADTNGDLFTCGVYPGFTGADGHIPVPFAMDPLVFLGSINYQALTSDPAPAGSFGYSNALYGYTGGITGVDPSGSNIAFIGQFTTDGTFTFNLNVALILPSPSTATEEYVHTSPNVGQIQSSLLIFPQPNLDCEGTPGGTALPGTACNDNNPLTGNDTWSANCVCAGLVIDCEGTPGGTALPGTACNDNDPLTGNDTWGANCVCAGLVIDCEGTPGGTALPGTACNDNDPLTGNDTWGANCVCAGLVIDCEGTPGGTALPGTACDDLNPNTSNDVWSANCVCAGVLANDCEGTPGGPAQPGTACNDNNPLTGNDTWDANCVCAGLLIDCEGTPGGTALPGTACNDNNPLTGNDTWDANCVCAGLLIDCEGTPGGTALPGTACDDLNPNTSNDVWSANCVCAGVLANDCEGTPGGPAQPGTACNDNNPLTGNDTWDANCVCAGLLIDCEGTPGGTALPGTACNDNNPLTGNDTWDANCVCAGLLIDCEGTPGGTALPGTSCNDNNPLTGNDTWDANCVCAGLLIDCEGTPGGAALPGTACNDNNACTINDVYDANCNCSGTFEDTDSDGVCDANDNCPTVAGQIGSACDDGNSNTINDQLNAACQCVGTPVGPGCDFNEVELVVENDAVSIVSYEVRAQGTNILAANGSVNPGTGTTVQDICLPDGCYYLVVSDNGGDGIVGGGYVLRLAAGGRLIDNAGNMTVSPSQIAANEGFCLPLGSDRLIATSCDKLDWRTAPCVPEYVVANANALVSAQYGVTNTTSGYQMWWYDPNGGYSFKRFQSHSTANGLVASATRACHFKINAWTGNQLQEGVLYNVKVRGRVAGTYNAWGPACRFSVDNAAAQCPQARLNNIAGNQFFSCGVTRPVAANAYVYSTVVRRMQANCNWLNANRYQFRFRIASEGFELVKTSSTWSVNTLGLACGKTYEVDVRASFDGGASWCATGDPYGTVCSLTTTACSFGMAQEATSGTAVEARLSMYPNPNRGDQLFLSIGSIEEGVETVSVDIYDAFGKRVSARTIAAQDGFVNSMVELNGELSAGFYLVNVTAGGASWSERLVIQR